IRLKDNKSLSEFLRQKIGKVPTVKSTRTIIVLETTKETSRIYQSEQLKTDDT
ncbi:Lrp/AsnC ligand binding domain-containing protein, partial [candidate division KSB1 bacterium]|nr:Lrp/AsnC ligand binding domain-containing protein [candidate division KSB1 bacterium]